jgi:hypothetical protein
VAGVSGAGISEAWTGDFRPSVSTAMPAVGSENWMVSTSAWAQGSGLTARP